MTIERIPAEDWQNQHGHIYRYELAAKYLQPKETVLDVASGIGYGAKILTERADINYRGADKIAPDMQFAFLGKFWIGVDLDIWEPPFKWDVSVSFETLEHVKDPAKLATTLKQAKRLIILSTPTRPTMHMNPYHLHDFTVQDVLNLFNDWEVLHLEDQPEELSHIFVFQRKADNDS